MTDYGLKIFALPPIICITTFALYAILLFWMLGQAMLAMPAWEIRFIFELWKLSVEPDTWRWPYYLTGLNWTVKLNVTSSCRYWVKLFMLIRIKESYVSMQVCKQLISYIHNHIVNDNNQYIYRQMYDTF